MDIICKPTLKCCGQIWERQWANRHQYQYQVCSGRARWIIILVLNGLGTSCVIINWNLSGPHRPWPSVWWEMRFVCVHNAVANVENWQHGPMFGKCKFSANFLITYVWLVGHCLSMQSVNCPVLQIDLCGSTKLMDTYVHMYKLLSDLSGNGSDGFGSVWFLESSAPISVKQTDFVIIYIWSDHTVETR